MSTLVDFETLAAWAGYDPATVRGTTLRRWLESQGIAYSLNSTGRPVTTLNQIDAALGIGFRAASPDWKTLHETATKGPRQG